jgi:hypothetical protein
MATIEYNLRMLVNQEDNQVVWLTNKEGPAYIPKIGIGFDYIPFIGSSPVAIMKEYRHGRLSWVDGRFESCDFSDTIARTLMLRMKCLSLRYVDYRINTLSENFLELDRVYNAFKVHAKQDQDNTQLAKTLSRIHQCSLENASRLIRFKTAEYENIITEFESVRYEHSIELRRANTIDEVFDAHRRIGIKLLHHPGVADREIRTMKTKFSTLND